MEATCAGIGAAALARSAGVVVVVKAVVEDAVGESGAGVVAALSLGADDTTCACRCPVDAEAQLATVAIVNKRVGTFRMNLEG